MSPTPQPTDTLLADGAPPEPRARGPFAAIRRALPAGEVIRFLMVGVSNTLFSLGFYSACVVLYSHLLPHYGKPLIADIASITSKPVCITVAFLCYKHFVFRTHGHYLKEWLRCFAVYRVSTPAELIFLPVGTNLFSHVCDLRLYAPFL